MTAFYSTLAVLAYLLVFWYLYVLVMGFYRASLAGRLVKWSIPWWLALPAILVGIVVDLLANWTIAAVWFMELPAFDVFNLYQRPDLVTSRLTRYLATDYPVGRNKTHARLICNYLLDPFDPSGSHCGDAPKKLF